MRSGSCRLALVFFGGGTVDGQEVEYGDESGATMGMNGDAEARPHIADAAGTGVLGVLG